MAVYNKHHRNAPAGAVYIGRGSPWGNPYVIGKDGDRAAVIEKFEAYARSRPELIARMCVELAGKDMLCFCDPLPCHGHVIDRLIAEYANQPTRKINPFSRFVKNS